MSIHSQRQSSLIATGGTCAWSICALGTDERMKRSERYPISGEIGFVPAKPTAISNGLDSLNQTQEGDPRSA